MIHQYKLNGRNIVIDVYSGSVHLVDDVAYDIIRLFCEKSREESVDQMMAEYGDREDVTREEVEACWEDVLALKEMGKLKTRVGQTILSAAIIDDVIGIIVLTFVLGFKDPDSNTLLVTGKILLFLVLSLVLGIVIYKLFKFYDDRHAHTRRIPIIAITLCFIMAFAAEKYFGIADITGAYIAGIILCNVRDAEYIDRRISINGYMFFAPVFFVSIGLKTDFSNVDSSMIVFSIGFVIVAMLSKVIGCGLASKCFKYSWTDCLKIGAGMMTRGEVALIITNKGLGLGIIDSSYFTAVILLIIVSSIVTPVVLKLLFGKSDKGTKEAALATAKK